MQRFVIGEKYLTSPPPENKTNKRKKRSAPRRVKDERRKRGRRKNHTCERRTNFPPANISKVQQHALLQRIKDVFAGYRIS
jgi:hypothetical protein